MRLICLYPRRNALKTLLGIETCLLTIRQVMLQYRRNALKTLLGIETLYSGLA